MPIAPLPTPLQHLGGRRFSFYPPILRIEHNEWLYRRETWSECVVANLRSGEEVCIPRRFLGEVSIVDDPVIIVGLNRELEWSGGAILPHVRRVIELPLAVNDSRPAPSRPAHLAPVVNIRLEPKPEFRAGKWIGAALLLGVVAFSIVAEVMQSHPQLNPGDDFNSIETKLGRPGSDRSREINGQVCRLLGYPSRHLSVVLMGSTAADARYIGIIDWHGRGLSPAASESLLRSLMSRERFSPSRPSDPAPPPHPVSRPPS